MKAKERKTAETSPRSDINEAAGCDRESSAAACKTELLSEELFPRAISLPLLATIFFSAAKQTDAAATAGAWSCEFRTSA